jgi:hypothetical protein
MDGADEDGTEEDEAFRAMEAAMAADQDEEDEEGVRLFSGLARFVNS